MITKGIAATTKLDKHNCKITKEALEEATKGINESPYVPGAGLNHDPSVLPIGKTIRGELIPFEENEYAVQIYQDIFLDEFEKITTNNQNYYYGASKVDNRPFADTELENVDKLDVSLDPVNFSNQDYETMKQFIESECNANSQDMMRKSLIPDPEVIFTLLSGTLLFWTGKKTLEKLSNDISTDIAKSYAAIKKAILKVAKYAIPQNRPITYVFRESNEYVLELIIQTPKPADVFEATKEENISSIFDEINHISKLINSPIAKIQFLYSFSDCKWEFNYLTTNTGEVLGTEKCYKKTAKVFENTIKSTTQDDGTNNRKNTSIKFLTKN